MAKRPQIDITQDKVEKILATIDAGLSNGLGKPTPGQMCIEAAVCYGLGLPHGDDPACVSPYLRRLKIGLNDRNWSSPQARAKGLRRLGLAQLGSAGVLDETEFRKRVQAMTIRKAVPVGLRAAAKLNPKHADALEAAAVRCEQEGTRDAALNARKAADAAADAAAAAAAAAAYAAATATAAADAAAAAAYAAADYADAAAAAAAAAAYAAAAYADAAAAAAAAAAYAAAAYAAAADYAAARDKQLAEYAEWVVEILIDMKAPGCQWLFLAPKAVA